MKISYKSNINDAINEILRHFLLILPLKMKVELFIARKLKLGNGKSRHRPASMLPPLASYLPYSS